MARLKPAEFDERMTLVEHLDELRTRIVVSGFVLLIAIALCFWQDELLLDIANEPLPAGLRARHLQPDRAVLHHREALVLRRAS